jgi:hypothetical protein
MKVNILSIYFATEIKNNYVHDTITSSSFPLLLSSDVLMICSYILKPV